MRSFHAAHGNQVPEYSLNAVVSGDFFSGLGIQPVLGRAFRPVEDAVAGRDAAADRNLIGTVHYCLPVAFPHQGAP